VNDTLRLEVPDDAWDPVGPPEDPTARLLLTLSVGHCSLHLEAWALADRGEDGEDDGIQQLVVLADALDDLANAVGATGPFETHEINGRGYVLVASPFCA
jgi:hypothetical protein